MRVLRATVRIAVAYIATALSHGRKKQVRTQHNKRVCFMIHEKKGEEEKKDKKDVEQR